MSEFKKLIKSPLIQIALATGICIIIMAYFSKGVLPEPIGYLPMAIPPPFLMTIHGAFSDRYPLWAIIYVGIHIFLINFSQLIIFRKYDFISMYSFRLVYYMIWHIGWGYLRLKLLF